jgi:hypothetical protein
MRALSMARNCASRLVSCRIGLSLGSAVAATVPASG